MIKYRFFRVLNGVTMYYRDCGDDLELVPARQAASLFTEGDWRHWGQDAGASREEIGEDERMRLMGAPVLPGLEAV